ncbi:MAG: WecB/TagA/CpsF family glycosyltransferase [Spirochaetales bacterium]|jgi:N-acetylglucosaminyldiphosphoundecaprenol N-acetyl-beta-D-mannosaminyltransferase|nr:WecB/TagA/CpsF family glycosyltransferase [Spirochaetales bacterium]
MEIQTQTQTAPLSETPQPGTGAGTGAGERIYVTGIPVDHFAEEGFEDRLSLLTACGKAGNIVFLSLWDLMRARRDREFRRLLEQAALVIPVSRGIQRGAAFLKKTVPARYMPFEFVIRFLAALEERQRSLYLLGCTPEELQSIEQNLRQTFPGLKIVGRYTGSYPRAKDKDIRTAIKKAAPHCVLMGSGIRGKEKWFFRRKDDFSTGVFIWSASVMDIISGKRKKVSRETFQKGREFIPELIRRPWRAVRGIVYLYFGLLLLVYRLKKT